MEKFSKFGTLSAVVARRCRIEELQEPGGRPGCALIRGWQEAWGGAWMPMISSSNAVECRYRVSTMRVGIFMQWSKLKARVKERICPELRSRIDFHLTSYRRSHDEAEKVWITIDGVRVATYSWYQRQWRPAARDEGGRLVRRDDDALVALREGDPAWAEAAKVARPQDFGKAMRLYLDLKIQEALRPADPIIRAFALIVRGMARARCGLCTCGSMTIR